MLSIIARPWPETDTAPDIVHSPEKEFNLFYTQEWLDEEWSRRVISDIQGFSVMDSSRHVSDILWDHHMTPNSLAGGTMNLLVFKHAFDGRKCRMSRMGENCYHWLMDKAEEKDICGVITTFVFFRENDLQGRPVYFPDIGVTAKTEREFSDAVFELNSRRLWRYEIDL